MTDPLKPTMFKDVAAMSPEEIDEVTYEQIRNALALLSGCGYEIHHNEFKLVRGKGASWTWQK